MKIQTTLLKKGGLAVLASVFLLSSCYLDDFIGDGYNNPPKVTTIVGEDFPANDGLSVDKNGKILASNFGVFDATLNKYNGTTIYEVTKTGKVKEKITGFEAPMGSVTDSKGSIYFNTENNNDAISGVLIKASSNGTSAEVAEIPGWPSGVTVDGDDNVYVANFFAPTIHKVTPDGTLTILATDNRLFGCVGIDIDSYGNIITANFFTADLLKVTPDGTVSIIANIPDTTQGFAIGYMAIFDDIIYATGISENVIYKIGFDGSTEIFAGTGENGSEDGLLNEATFSQPNGIAVDKKRGVLYISQYGTPGLRAIKL